MVVAYSRIEGGNAGLLQCFAGGSRQASQFIAGGLPEWKMEGEEDPILGLEFENGDEDRNRTQNNNVSWAWGFASTPQRHECV